MTRTEARMMLPGPGDLQNKLRERSPKRLPLTMDECEAIIEVIAEEMADEEEEE